MTFEPVNPDWKQRIHEIFHSAPFIVDLGARLIDVQPGLIISEIKLEKRHLQHNGFVHAGVQATLADHTGGAASFTLLPADRISLTAEFKINLLRAAKGERLVCRATVLKPGAALTVSESSVFAVENSHDTLVSKATVTLANVGERRA